MQFSGPDCVRHFNICCTCFRSRWCLSFQYLSYRFQDQIVYVISVYAIQVLGPDGIAFSVSVIQVTGPDGFCHFSICYTVFRTGWFM